VRSCREQEAEQKAEYEEAQRKRKQEEEQASREAAARADRAAEEKARREKEEKVAAEAKEAYAKVGGSRRWWWGASLSHRAAPCRARAVQRCRASTPSCPPAALLFKCTTRHSSNLLTCAPRH
jgi:hypothetical protein